jgi:hypothetical protein
MLIAIVIKHRYVDGYLCTSWSEYVDETPSLAQLHTNSHEQRTHIIARLVFMDW